MGPAADIAHRRREDTSDDDTAQPRRKEELGEDNWIFDLAPDGCCVPLSYSLLQKCSGRERRGVRTRYCCRARRMCSGYGVLFRHVVIFGGGLQDSVEIQSEM